jgi:arylformamidase
MAIDYEVEYDNRARVPEHPHIFARWIGDAAAYRDRAVAAQRAELGLSCGPSARQTVDLFVSERGASAPLAVFVHGGWWRSLDPAMFSQMAAGLNGRGISVAVVGYDLCPQVSIARIVDQIRAACLLLWRRFGKRMMVYGHSAGGHLAGAMLATDWHQLDPSAPADLAPAAMAISGVFDLAPLVKISVNADLRLDAVEARRMSPLFWPAPKGQKLDAVVGGSESAEFLRQSHAIVDGWGGAGVVTRYQEIPGANHFTVLDELSDPASALVARLVEIVPPR